MPRSLLNRRNISSHKGMRFRHQYRNYKIKWKKLAMVVCALSAAVSIILSSRIQCPLTVWYLLPSETVASVQKLNRIPLINESMAPPILVGGFPPILGTPFGPINSTFFNVTYPGGGRTTGFSQEEKLPREQGEVVMEHSPNTPTSPVRLVDSPVLNIFGPKMGVTSPVSHWKNHSTEEKASPVSYVKSPSKEGKSQTMKRLTVPKAMIQRPFFSPPKKSSYPSQHKNPKMFSSPDQELFYAKKEIENAPLITDDPELYAPLFKNLSVFKRSYDLMERILKIYVYKDGPRPIFHSPGLKGIYASEGWFMKLMEGSKQFVVNDPNMAHLFYLPYSTRNLQLSLYVPDSHNMKPLSVFLKDYINSISTKYPFWNRTRGSDHFLVACHDWGPYITVGHEELCKNTIKALCNADESEGIFTRGKDVSLPETYIKNPRRPLKDIGGKPISQRSILAFFSGRRHGRVRPTLLKYWDGKDEDMKVYALLPGRVSRTMSYIQHMKSSKFCLCPMGYEVNSPRIVEAIYYECVPVIIADNFVLPFEEVLEWSTFSVVVAEKDIPNLKEILTKIPMRRYISMQTNVKMLKKHFLWNYKPVKYDLFNMILHSIWFSRVNQIQIPQG